MLDSVTKKRIDDLRDILVGKLPDPKSQVEQITIALIYKFMDDMDRQSVELGGNAQFFSNKFEQYSWRRIFTPSLSGNEVVRLYGEAITEMNNNPGIPQLFRNIFKNAYLPYRDPETLKSFLKLIDDFNYSHSEKLGDAFEYLLSIMGSQGDAGQFRTPRHIIDFIVEVVAPEFDETKLDPSVGTAGFLISAYKHILNKTTVNGVSKLSPSQRAALVNSFTGYDISPDMVRLSLVNLYLHNFPNPRIYEYDTLTSEERWNERFDVIFANPPFMTPKGGIKPHSKFSVQANRSEVLFVDYIAEHLNSNGRAGVIVPEGIIFQSGKAYKQLRKMLVENYLYAVVSLPAGVFNPYSGVKTSILFMDKQLSKKTDSILFVKAENDGYGLGAQRREIELNDLPKAALIIKAFTDSIRKGAKHTIDESKTAALLVPKSKLAETGDYNLTGDRHKITEKRLHQKWPMVKISDICDIERGASPRPIDDYMTDSIDGINWIKIGDANQNSMYITKTKDKVTEAGAKKSRSVKKGDFILSNSMSFGRPYILDIDGCIHDGWLALRYIDERIVKEFLYHILSSSEIYSQFTNLATGGVVNNLNSALVRQVQIPLPPIEIQREIVAEIDGYQKVIDGARQVVENWKPQIEIDPDWPMVKLGDVLKLSSGKGLTQSKLIEGPFKVYGGNGVNGNHSEFFLEESTIVIGRVGAYCGAVHITDPKSWVTDNGLYVVEYKIKVNQNFIAQHLIHLNLNQYAKVGGQPSISQNTVYELKIPLPSLEAQKEIVEKIEAERRTVDACKELIKTYEAKIKKVIDKVWEE